MLGFYIRLCVKIISYVMIAYIVIFNINFNKINIIFYNFPYIV